MVGAGSSRSLAVIIIAGSLVVFLTLGVRAAFGLFLEPMSHDLGTGRGLFALAIALQNLLWGAAQPLAGAVADRYGSGRVIAVGGLLYGLGVLVMSQAVDPLTLTIGAGFLVGLGLAGASFSVVLAAVGRAVSEERRSMVLGAVTSMGSFGQLAITPLGQAFLQSYGWSTALVLLGFGVLLVVPLAGGLSGRVGAAAGPEQSLGQALGEAGRHGSYLYLTAGFFVCGFHVTFIATHLPAYLTDAGLSGETAAWAIGVIGFFNVIGSFAAGYLGGRYSKKYLLSAIYSLRAAAIALFILMPLTDISVMIFAAAIGLLWLSTVPPTSGLVAQMFGPRYMATLFGIVFFSHQVGAFAGAWLGGILYDRTGSYDVVWWSSVALGIIAAALHWPIQERPVARLAAAD